MDDLALARWGTRFVHDGTERAYRAWHVEQAVPFTRVGMIASIVNWVLGALTFWIVTPQHALEATAWIALGPTPVIVAALLVSYRPARRTWMLPLTALANAVAGGTLVVLFQLYTGLSDSTCGGVVLVAFFGFSIFRLHPPAAALAAGSYLIATAVLVGREWHAGRLPLPNFSVDICLLLLAFQTGLLICVALDRVSRETYRQERTIERQRSEIQRERERADRLLANVLPDAIAARLKDDPRVIADRFEGVSVIFADVVGFTALASKISPERLVEVLNEIFTRFDELAEAHGVEKIKTIGDAYMAVAGVPEPRADHATAAARMALAMRDAIAELGPRHGIQVRIGIASGAAVAGVIGKRKFAYDLWGDTVNTAARMESHGIVGAIHVAESTSALLRDAFEIEERGTIDVKGKGEMRTYLLVGPGTGATS